MRKKVYRKRIRGFPKIAFALFALFPIFCMWGETDEKDNQIIVDFMKNYVNVDVLDIKYEGIEGKEYKDSLSPKPFLLGINYRKYRVKTNLPLIFPELYIPDGGDKVIYLYGMDPKISTPVVEKDRVLSKEEAIKGFEPIIKYLRVDDNPNLSSPEITEYDKVYFICMRRVALLNGIPCRYKGLRMLTSTINGMVDFRYTLSIQPKNQKPKEPCPVDKVNKVATKYMLSLSSRLKRFMCHSAELVPNTEIKLVIAPAYDSLEGWKDRNYYYAWEVPFKYTSFMMSAHNKLEESEGVMWIEVEKLEPIGMEMFKIEL